MAEKAESSVEGSMSWSFVEMLSDLSRENTHQSSVDYLRPTCSIGLDENHHLMFRSLASTRISHHSLMNVP